MKGNKRVGFVGHRDMFFGAESVMYRVLKIVESNQNVHPIIILPKSGFKGFTDEVRNKSEVKLFYFHFKLIGQGLFRSFLCIIHNLINASLATFELRREKVDLFYVNTSVNIFGAILAWILGKPLLWHFHEQPNNTGFKWIPNGLFFCYRFLINRKNTKVIFISETQKKSWESEFSQQIVNSVVIYTPPAILPLVLEADISDTVNIGFLGSFTTSKNVPLLLNAFDKVKKLHPLTVNKLRLMGDGEDKKNILNEIKRLGIMSDVEIISHSRHTIEFFNNIHIFVLPSKFESWGLVVLEAMSQKKAVIVTENTGLKELFVDGEDCRFINPLDETKLVNILSEFVTNPGLRKQYGDNAYRKLISLNFEQTFEENIISLI